MEDLLEKPVLMAPPASPELLSQEDFEDPLSEADWTSDEDRRTWAPKRRKISTYPVTQIERTESALHLLQAIDREDKSLKSANLWNNFLQHLTQKQCQQHILEKLLEISTILLQVTLIHYNTYYI